AYDDWLTNRIRRELPPSLAERFDDLVAEYKETRARGRAAAQEFDAAEAIRKHRDVSSAVLNRGGKDPIFAWFFRGDGPTGVLSGANVQQRFLDRTTFLADNTTAWILDCSPDRVRERMTAELGLDGDELRGELARIGSHYLPDAQKPKRTD